LAGFLWKPQRSATAAAAARAIPGIPKALAVLLSVINTEFTVSIPFDRAFPLDYCVFDNDVSRE
jgi:hypothetical protein